MKRIIAGAIGLAALVSCGYQTFDSCDTAQCCEEAYTDCYYTCDNKTDNFDKAMCIDVCQRNYHDCIGDVK